MVAPLRLDKMPCTVHRFSAMGCPCAVVVGKPWQRHLPECEAEVRRIERKYSRFDHTSYLMHLNQQARVERVAVDHETAVLLAYANECFVQSDGLFDVTSGALSQIWKLKSGEVPSEAEIRLALAGVGWCKVGFDGKSVAYHHAAVTIDLGGIAKEYAVDRLVMMLMAEGVEYGWVNLGGDMRVFGGVLPVGVRAPVSGQSNAVATYQLSTSIATSGDYERCLWVEGVRYSHLIDPNSGWPVRDGLGSVTVVADECMVAGSLSTVGVLKPRQQALTWLGSLGVDYLALSHDGQVAGTLLNRALCGEAGG